ncbi:hypothetical protein XU18_2295, partial [Perkinsela sp. CCAP 1560/4]
GFDPRKLSCKVCESHLNVTLHETIAFECMQCCHSSTPHQPKFTRGSILANQRGLVDIPNFDKLLDCIRKEFPNKIDIQFVDYGTPQVLLDGDECSKTFNLLECEPLDLINYLRKHIDRQEANVEL